MKLKRSPYQIFQSQTKQHNQKFDVHRSELDDKDGAIGKVKKMKKIIITV